MKPQEATTWSLETIERLRQKLVPDWILCWCGDPWTQFGKVDGPRARTIHMKVWATDEETVQCFLHEACHALRGKGGHPQDFWDELELLIRNHLGTGLCAPQVEMKKDYLTSQELIVPKENQL